MGITTKDIAKICGVSRGTVDRALNGKDRINPQTKNRILATAKKLGYRKDMLARGLVKGTTMYIGVVVFDIRNHYFSQMVNAIELEAIKKGYFVNITLHEKNQEKEYQLINSLVDRRVDGIIVCPVNKGPEFAKFLKNLQIPVVVIGNMVSDDIPFVGIDEKQATEDAAAGIVAKGYEQIVFVCPPLADQQKENIYTHEQRYQGFVEYTRQQKQIETEVVGSWNFLEQIDHILQHSGKRTAIFCSGDIYALQIMSHLKKNGFRVPEDVGIMGFDNIDMLEFLEPALTTISNEIGVVGRTAVDLLVSLMSGAKADTHILIPHRVIAGNSL